MNSQAAWDEVITAASRLVEAAGKRRGRIQVSPEVAAALEAIGAAAAAAPQAPSSVAPIAAPDTAPASPVADSLDRIAEEVAACTLCGLHKTRHRVVAGEGHPRASLVFVGEAPGQDEDREGRPFIGRAGGLLTDIIVKGMQLQREEVYICNVLKCHPPGNRDPNPEEVYYCEPYLIRQLDLIQPKVICALGRHAAQTLLKTTESTGRLRGRWHNYHNIPLRVTYHPAYLLRSPSEKRKTWEDIQEVMKVLNGEVQPKI